MAFKSILLGFFFYFLQYYLISAEDKPCGGHDLKVNHFRNCPEPNTKSQNIRIHNVTVTLTDDCKLVPRGCFKVKKSISSAKVDYTISKPPFKKKGSEDFCKMLESPETQKYIENYRTLPKKCNVPPGDYCISKGSTKIDQLNGKTLNLLSGTTTGTFTVENKDSSDKACVEFKITVTKKG